MPAVILSPRSPRREADGWTVGWLDSAGCWRPVVRSVARLMCSPCGPNDAARRFRPLTAADRRPSTEVINDELGKPAAITCQPRSPGVGFASDNVPSFVGLSRLSCHLTSPFQFVSVLNLLLTRRRRLEFLPPSVDVRPGRSNVFGKK